MNTYRGGYGGRGTAAKHGGRGFERGTTSITSTSYSMHDPETEPVEQPFQEILEEPTNFPPQAKDLGGNPDAPDMPEFAPSIWFRNVKQYYRWDPLIGEEVRSAFIAKAMKSLRQVATRLGKETDVLKTAWCPSKVRKQLLEYRASDKFQQKSIKCSKSRTLGERARTTHCQGSITLKKLKEKMIEELKREVSAAEVF